MVVPTAPLNLSADSTKKDQAKLVWSIPSSDGGSPITGYKIERSDDGGAFNVIQANTGNTDTKFTDDTIGVQVNGVYRVSAINTSGTGPASDTASTTTATSEAQTIKQLLFDNWSLTGELSKTVSAEMTENVRFLNRGQVPGNKTPKMVTVQKINELGNEGIVEHPKFFEESDIFEITCFLQVIDSVDGKFNVWVDRMQQMTSEVTKILRTVYSPSDSTGEFFRTNSEWSKDDTFIQDEPELTRTLRFTLTRIKSNDPEVFLGYTQILVFDMSASEGDNLPTNDYTYTQVERVEYVQGWRNIPYITTDGITETAIPIYYRGSFSGVFRCNMILKKSDITPTTLNALNKIFLPQNSGELGTAVLLHKTVNTETAPITLTDSIPVNITQVEKISENEELVKYRIRGNLTAPSTLTVSVP